MCGVIARFESCREENARRNCITPSWRGLARSHALNNLSTVPSLLPAPDGAALGYADGRCHAIGWEEARALFRSGDVLIANTAFVSGRLRTAPVKPLFDVLELFAFVRPAVPLVPSALGLARVLGLPVETSASALPRLLHEAATQLLSELRGFSDTQRTRLRPLAALLNSAGWRWGPLIKEIVGEAEGRPLPFSALAAWHSLPEWEDDAPPDKPSSIPVESEEARARLARLVGDAGEIRREQQAFTEEATHAFGVRERAGAPRVVLLEAGTGVGKTLGYLAPASLWAEKNGPGLWLSTYTRNLQRQIVQEISRLYPDPAEREEKAVIRKGRENYLCLLNYEDAARRHILAPGQRLVALGLIARWIAASADGDVSGAGFPSFLASSFPIREITDRRGECIYSACPHYRVCFIERVVRRSRRAPIVVANHALVIAQAALDWTSGESAETAGERRVRYVFDEGHHLFDAADSGFSAHLCGREMAELRRWIRGAEGRTRGRHRGLEERLKDLISEDAEARLQLDRVGAAAGALAGDYAVGRISGAGARNAGEVFLAAVWQHVRARSSDSESLYSLEAGTEPLGEDLRAAARDLQKSLADIARPLLALAASLRKKLDLEAKELDSAERARLDAAARGLERRAKQLLPAWISMLDSLEQGAEPEFVDWFEVERDDGRDADVGLRRHWIDPTIPLTSDVLTQAHGVLITSATLRDSDAGAGDWQSAEVRTGAHHLVEPPKRASFGSPFRYADQARIFVVRDIERREPDALAAAYRELFLAAGGGALGLFTSVRMLRTVEERIAAPLARAGLTLYAQHVDRLDTGTLVDLFRAEENACVLGTDALRDGVDVPGRSLRLVVFDKIPWPRPTILHKARRARFGRSYDDLLTRLRLKQAFGRLIRSQNDKGCFVVLESATPSRLLNALPPETPVKRCGLAETVAEVREFLR
ncbi:MAG TPA: ATP-dependent DNA helicase [Rhizomicrobium sp.]|jgi:ATP-dependent DNA helicase DinG|nr:ATP-dependent DNA helicase [Rhizomicrobium sp.]